MFPDMFYELPDKIFLAKYNLSEVTIYNAPSYYILRGLVIKYVYIEAFLNIKNEDLTPIIHNFLSLFFGAIVHNEIEL